MTPEQRMRAALRTQILQNEDQNTLIRKLSRTIGESGNVLEKIKKASEAVPGNLESILGETIEDFDQQERGVYQRFFKEVSGILQEYTGERGGGHRIKKRSPEEIDEMVNSVRKEATSS